MNAWRKRPEFIELRLGNQPHSPSVPESKYWYSFLFRPVFGRRPGTRQNPVDATVCYVLAATQAIVIWSYREAIGFWILMYCGTSLILDHSWLLSIPILAIGIRLGLLGQEFKKSHELGVVIPEREAIAARIRDSALNGTLEDEAFVLYLRSFATAGKLRIANPYLRSIPFLPGYYGQPTSIDLESALTDSLWKWLPVVAEGGEDFVVGAGRIRSTEDEWQQTIEALASKARLILFVPHDSPGCRWELRTLMRRNWQDKTIFIMPPASAITPEQWGAARDGWAKEGVTFPPYKATGEIFKINAEGRRTTGAKLSTLFMFRPGSRLLALAERGCELSNRTHNPAAPADRKAPLSGR